MLLVRNLQAGPTVFSDKTSDTAIEWAGRGDPSGDDIQQVPEALLKDNISFLRSIRRGVLEIVEPDEETRALLDRQVDSWKAREAAGDQAAKEAIDPAANNDIITVPCIGPNSRGNGDCGEPVTVREKTKDANPPLCQQHEMLAGSFALTQTGNVVEGKAEEKWVRAINDPRERQSV
jgi:hypothetical protein